MNDRATPETDVLSKKQLIRISRSSNDAAALLRDALEEMEAYARKLERERDEAREERDALKADKDLIAGQLFAARGMYEDRDIIAAERDAVLAKLAKCREALGHIARYPNITATAMRDCARATLEATK